MAYERVTGPLDVRLRNEISGAIIAATVHNTNSKKTAKPSDFLPTWFKRKKTPKEIWQDVLKANAALGGSVRKSE
jgi:hypothetical protein